MKTNLSLTNDVTYKGKLIGVTATSKQKIQQKENYRLILFKIIQIQTFQQNTARLNPTSRPKNHA